MSTEHFPIRLPLEVQMQWDDGDSLEVKRGNHEQFFRATIERLLQQFVDDGELPAERAPDMLDHLMVQAEPMIAAHFAKFIGRQAMH
jgi:hypothetical protein